METQLAPLPPSPLSSPELERLLETISTLLSLRREFGEGDQSIGELEFILCARVLIHAQEIDRWCRLQAEHSRGQHGPKP